MVTEIVTRKRINVSFPESVLALLEKVVPSRERNGFIVNATEEALRREHLLNALQASAGAWTDEEHPDLMTVEDVDRYVRRLRETWMPRSWDEILEGTQRDG
jgi:hypothetical protein